MRKGSATVALVVVALLGTGVAGAGASGSAPAKKRCHFVKKRVHGKIKRVRVCKKAKPKPKPTKPKDVAITLDATRQVTASIGPAGGTVAAASATGATAMLSLPAGALEQQTTVTVTPLTTLKAGGVKLLAGVQFAPEGLAFEKPVTLTLTVPGAGAKVFGLAWFGTGHNVHVYPVTRSGSTFTMRLAHFSGAGVATGNSNLLPTLRTALTVAYAREVRPLMRQAETNDALFTPAVDAAFRWLKATELVGLEDEFRTFRAETFASLRKIFANAIAKASERCTNHDLTQLNVLAKLDQKAQSLGLDIPGPTGAERIEACAQFELELDGVGSLIASNGSLDHHVHAVVPIRMEDASFHGEGPLETQGLTLTNCGSGTATTSGPLIVDSLRVVPGPTPPPDVSLVLRMPQGDASFSCRGGPVFNLPATYELIWVIDHQNAQAGGLYSIDGWQWIGGEIVARKEYDISTAIAQGAAHEHTTLVLRHTPATL